LHAVTADYRDGVFFVLVEVITTGIAAALVDAVVPVPVGADGAGLAGRIGG
jgi:hypothetical protein